MKTEQIKLSQVKANGENPCSITNDTKTNWRILQPFITGHPNPHKKGCPSTLRNNLFVDIGPWVSLGLLHIFLLTIDDVDARLRYLAEATAVKIVNAFTLGCICVD